MPSPNCIANRKAAGLCVTCGRQPDQGTGKTCALCKQKSRDARALNKAKGNCLCGNKPEEGKRTCIGCSLLLRKSKTQVVEHYGGKCACCGEDGLQFLAVDHIKGNGKEMRRSHPKSGTQFYRWLIRNKFPEHFQLLCHNCNMAKGTGIACPHQLDSVIRLNTSHPDQLSFLFPED